MNKGARADVVERERSLTGPKEDLVEVGRRVDDMRRGERRRERDSRAELYGSGTSAWRAQGSKEKGHHEPVDSISQMKSSVPSSARARSC